ncbi:hypothetical protein LIX82_002748 [Vibrio parahaemolyticus]|uniref:hypothetical protein n=1 Tax=Vibrio TaxID=662 RepID=UPI0001F5B5EB|nr:MULTISPECIES: hypothetical protein [Vibrio]ETZ11777.1 hypothetical protein AJ90_24180 [Vibrio parahaemolyticus M0605]HAS3149896.1 hypothetical protein [Vibrio cholerae]ADV86601.1 hypothetical protein VVMO6_01579 [Vibrio vulnificus MO6-24/O]EGQ8242153.1 hypothetical protein [Vibrio parahaemolyticus]EGQ8965461.1 hypothetical protein [Vibrio parahaemolyticus]
MIFKVHTLVKLIVNRKLEGFKILSDEEAVKNGKPYNTLVFQYEGKRYKVDYKDMYWRSYTVGLMGAEGTTIDCPEVKPVEKTIIVYEEVV